MGESLLQGFPEAVPCKPAEKLQYADVSSLLPYHRKSSVLALV